MQTTATKIPYVNIPLQHAALKDELLAAIGDVIDQGQFILGPQVEQFEKEFAELCCVEHAIGVNSGTDALVLALQALGVGPGDEVITAPNSFVATATAIVLAGAKPVFVDVSEDYNLDPGELAGAITPRTKAILPVHLTGRPCDMAPILEFARHNDLEVIEDCAQAVLAEYKGQRVGSFGAIGCFSLHPLKTLNACGDGGVLTTNDAVLADKLRVLRNIGLRTRDDCQYWSGNSRLDTMQAAVLLVKLQHLPRWTERRRENAQFYQEQLANIPAIRFPRDTNDIFSVYHTFVIQSERRDALREFLTARGIGTAVHYPTPIHLTQAWKSLGYTAGSFPVAEELAQKIVSLPVYPELESSDLEFIVQSIRAFYER